MACSATLLWPDVVDPRFVRPPYEWGIVYTSGRSPGYGFVKIGEIGLVDPPENTLVDGLIIWQKKIDDGETYEQ